MTDQPVINDPDAAVRRANVQVAAGVLNQPPYGSDGAFQVQVQAQGRRLAQFHERFDLLLGNAKQSLILVVVILALFMGLRVALWVGMGIVVSFLGGVATMPLLGVSANMVSLFAFILVLGIVVDDAIVVSEEVQHRHLLGERGLDAAVRGARAVVVPVVFSVLTTVAAFLPMAMLPGTFGKIFFLIPAIVIPVLLLSLLESMLTLPGHLALHHDLSGRTPSRVRLVRTWHALRGLCDGALMAVARRSYAPALGFCLRWRHATLAGFIAVAMLTVGLIAHGTLPLTFFPRVEQDFMMATITMPAGSSRARRNHARTSASGTRCG